MLSKARSPGIALTFQLLTMILDEPAIVRHEFRLELFFSHHGLGCGARILRQPVPDGLAVIRHGFHLKLFFSNCGVKLSPRCPCSRTFDCSLSILPHAQNALLIANERLSRMVVAIQDIAQGAGRQRVGVVVLRDMHGDDLLQFVAEQRIQQFSGLVIG